jgi:hypothetical protein
VPTASSRTSRPCRCIRCRWCTPCGTCRRGVRPDRRSHSDNPSDTHLRRPRTRCRSCRRRPRHPTNHRRRRGRCFLQQRWRRPFRQDPQCRPHPYRCPRQRHPAPLLRRLRPRCCHRDPRVPRNRRSRPQRCRKPLHARQRRHHDPRCRPRRHPFRCCRRCRWRRHALPRSPLPVHRPRPFRPRTRPSGSTRKTKWQDRGRPPNKRQASSPSSLSSLSRPVRPSNARGPECYVQSSCPRGKSHSPNFIELRVHTVPEQTASRPARARLAEGSPPDVPEPALVSALQELAGAAPANIRPRTALPLPAASSPPVDCQGASSSVKTLFGMNPGAEPLRATLPGAVSGPVPKSTVASKLPETASRPDGRCSSRRTVGARPSPTGLNRRRAERSRP